MAPTSSSALGREVRVEAIVGTVVFDVDGARAGRIEEILIEQRGMDWVVTEYHLGAVAMLERVMCFAAGLRVIALLERFTGRRRKASWDQMDLSDPVRPRLTVRRQALDTFEPE